MSSLLESYRILGVKVGADLATVTSSYRQLCREYHPDISDKPETEELMKQVNIAYTMLRDKFRREAAFREGAAQIRTATRRYSPPRQKTEPVKTREPSVDPQRKAAEDYHRKAAEQAAASAEAEVESRKVLHAYFKALNTFNYKKAYEFLSDYDKKNITPDSFARWRESVARLFPMREFKITANSSVAVVTWGGSKIFHARKFKVLVTEDDYKSSHSQMGEHDKLVIIENGQWRVFLGYREINELTKTFEKRFENKRKRDIEELWEEYAAGIDTEYDMLTLKGMRKAAAKELYRHRRYGSAVTFAAISISQSGDNNAQQKELLRGAAKTINAQLRETDVSAYAGDGIFVIMFVELGKRNAQNIVSRVADTIRTNAEPDLVKNAVIEYGFDSWSSHKYADFESVNEVLKKFGKKI